MQPLPFFKLYLRVQIVFLLYRLSGALKWTVRWCDRLILWLQSAPLLHHQVMKDSSKWWMIVVSKNMWEKQGSVSPTFTLAEWCWPAANTYIVTVSAGCGESVSYSLGESNCNCNVWCLEVTRARLLLADVQYKEISKSDGCIWWQPHLWCFVLYWTKLSSCWFLP